MTRNSYIPYKSYNLNINEKIDKLLNKYGKDLPIDVELIAEKEGFTIIPEIGIKEAIATDAFLANQRKEITYDPNSCTVRIRFSIAHELGHFYLHKQLIEDVHFNSVKDWKRYLCELPHAFWALVEKEANEFAGRLLVPRKALLQVIPKFKREIKDISDVLPEDISSIQEFLVPPLAKIFDVSGDVMRIRLINASINPFDLI